MNSTRHFLAVILLLTTIPARALTWNESTDGELSGDPNSPTALTFNVGANILSGTMGSDLPSVPPDRDIFTFTLTPDQLLTSIVFTVFTPTNQSFFAIAAGSTINISSSQNHLANTLVKTTGINLLNDLSTHSYSGGTGLPNPVPAGTYTIWFQELSSVVTYQATYTVTEVPEPAGVLTCVLIGLLALLVWRRRLRPA